MEYRTNNTDIISSKNIPTYLLVELMLQDAFLTNYKIGLGIVDEIISNDDNKQTYAKCKVAIKRQIRVQSDGTPVFKDYSPILARIVRWGNNAQSISTNIIKGQLCLLLFADRPFDNVWTQQPDADTGLIQTLPLTTYRAHDMGDCICIPFAHDVSLTDHTVINDNVTINGDLSVSGNLTVTGNITAAHIEAEDGFTGEKTDTDGKVVAKFNKGICIE